MSRAFLLLLFYCSSAAPALAQAPSQNTAPRIRRWLDVQHVQLSSRFRWVKSDAGRLTSSTHQWQPQLRARVLFDPAGRYALHVGAFGGSQFVSGWNNTGGGIGTFTGDFNVKQLFVSAEPRQGLEFQAGGLYIVRGENTEVTSYDNDAYVVGQRASLRRAAGPVSQLVLSAGHIGDYRVPNVFERLDSMVDINYGQLLVGLRLGARVSASSDYTYEDGRDILREGLSMRVPSALQPLTSMRVDAYQRISAPRGAGFNVSGDFRVTASFSITAGVAHVDRNYVIPGYMTPNADRFERGTRFYSQGTYAISRDLSVGWFHGEAFNVSYPIPNEHRWEILVTVNPTATLRAKGIF